jgi:hypothetical protein
MKAEAAGGNARTVENKADRIEAHEHNKQQHGQGGKIALDAWLASDRHLLRRLEGSFLQLRLTDLPMTEFVEAVARVFTHFDPSASQTEVVHGAASLFRRVDVSGTGTVSWEQLTRYVTMSVKCVTLFAIGVCTCIDRKRCENRSCWHRVRCF